VYVEQAIASNRGRIAFFKSEVQAFVARDPKGVTAVAAAIAALDRYQTFLETELLPKADGDWRLGKTLYEKKFPPALQTTRTPDQMLERAEAEFMHTRRALAESAKKLHAQLWPGQAPPSDDAALIGKVKDALSGDHAKPADLVAAHARRLDAL